MVVRLLDLFRSGARRATPTDTVRSRWPPRESGWLPPTLGAWRSIRSIGAWLSGRAWWPGRTWPSGRPWRSGRTQQWGSAVRSRWMAVTVALVVAAVLGIVAVPPVSLGGVGVLSAGYLAARKSAPSQALGTAGYVLGVLYAVGLQFGPAVAALLAGHAAKRYAVRTHPPGTFRRPVPGAPGYYYDPVRAGLADRVLASVASRWLAGPVPAVGPVGRLLLVGLDGVEVAGSELAADDPLYYLHRDSPGYVFASDDAAPSDR